MSKVMTTDDVQGKETAETMVLPAGATEYAAPATDKQDAAGPVNQPAEKVVLTRAADSDRIENPNRIESEGDESRRVKAVLAKQPKFKVTLPESKPGTDKENDPGIQIMGVWYQIKLGETVDVPQSVYEALVQSGRVPPQRPEDRAMRPRMTYAPGILSEQKPQNTQ